MRHLLAGARKVTGRDIPTRVGARRPGDPPELVSAPALAHERLGWSPRYPDVAEQIAHAWAWRQSGRRAFKRAQAAHAGQFG